MGINDFQKEINKVFGNKNFGLSTTFAGGVLLAVLFFFLFGVFGLIHKLYSTKYLEIIYFIIFGISSGIVSYIFVFRNDKYILYFTKFEKWTKEETMKYTWVTFLITIITFCLWITSF